MNKERRKTIEKTVGMLEDVLSILADVKDEEENAFDSMPENLQNSMRGDESQEAIGAMENAIEKIEDAVSELYGI